MRLAPGFMSPGFGCAPVGVHVDLYAPRVVQRNVDGDHVSPRTLPKPGDLLTHDDIYPGLWRSYDEADFICKGQLVQIIDRPVYVCISVRPVYHELERADLMFLLSSNAGPVFSWFSFAGSNVWRVIG